MNPPANAAGSWGDRVRRPPRLVIFDDDVDALAEFVKEFHGRGFDAIGVPVVSPYRRALWADAQGRIVPEKLNHAAVVKDLAPFTYLASSPDDVRQLLQSLQPDCMLTDCAMPDSDIPHRPGYKALQQGGQGYGMLEIARETRPGMARIIHSGAFPPFRNHGDHEVMDAQEQARAVADGHWMARKANNPYSFDKESVQQYDRIAHQFRAMLRAQGAGMPG